MSDSIIKQALCNEGQLIKEILTRASYLSDAPITAQALLAIDLFEKGGYNLLWIAADIREMVRLHETITTLQRFQDFAERRSEGSPFLFQPLDRDPAVFGEHLQISQHLAKHDPFILISCPQALECQLPIAEQADEAVKKIEVGDSIALDELSEWMSEAGYEFGVEVYLQGEAAIRGGILDVWPHGTPKPVRIEFFGDDVDSIRYFDDQTQCSIKRITSVQLPQVKTSFSNQKTTTLLSLLHEDTFVVCFGPLFSSDHPLSTIWNAGAAGFLCDINESCSSAIQFLDGDQVALSYDFFETGLSAVSHDLPPEEADESRRSFVIDCCKNERWTTFFFFETAGTLNRFKELYSDIDGFDALFLMHGVLHDSCMDIKRKVLIIAERDFYAYNSSRSAHARHSKRFKKQERINEAADIQPGDYVVHIEHGVGTYLGIVETSFSGRSQEVLSIEYAKGEKVYLPVTQAHLLTRYKGMGKHRPKPHTLGGKKWIRDREGASLAVKDLAVILLETQAERKLKRGHAFSKDSAWQTEFEAAFPYTETPDQLKAVEELKTDMEKIQPMDRLLCGDVGFGKTEVAMRAAFKAVMDGMQVAVLVPTTILAQQHYETFIERMTAFPVRIDMVSRFRTRSQQTKSIKDTINGDVDILIGTHRILSKDIAFKNLGLVLIDEEQRFGVEAKEKLKEMRKQVDVITMSATPIPRTLYMSMTGVRDLSTIKTAPQERQPIETNVIAYDEAVIKKAILQEMHRGGQVFYLHNRVKTIGHAEKQLSEIVPEARIAVAHGQMAERELAEIMHAFVGGRFDVLLCTTIIESGVDIPNCNTLIIENAERFGLSDLYQLRGRVGRSNHKAFAYMMLSPGGDLISSAQERMNAIKRYTGLGSGFRLALRDLELRGAGNMLGAKQSGHITAIGFDLYCQLLKRTIAIMQGKTPPPLMDVTVKLEFLNMSPHSCDRQNGAYIPYTYIEDENLRLRLYQRISALSSRSEIEAMKEEVRDRFGKLPQEFNRLFSIAELRSLAARRKIDAIIVRNQKVMLGRNKSYLMQGNRHPRLIENSASAKLKELIAMVRDFS